MSIIVLAAAAAAFLALGSTVPAYAAAASATEQGPGDPWGIVSNGPGDPWGIAADGPGDPWG
ncbi:hypothetical protein ACBI99_38100 [Nonomuraea sp. ATR24]|uniref:hypothetical protein n=1 Tax=Nonomuraea TaxID=83681 RepID=UPI001C5FCC03|nr:hypothetical protein [Nonomuraea ceibae]